MGEVLAFDRADQPPEIPIDCDQDNPSFGDGATADVVVDLPPNVTPLPNNGAKQELLAADEEVELAKRIEAGLYADTILTICGATAVRRQTLREIQIVARAAEILRVRHNSSKDPELVRQARITATIDTDELIASAVAYGIPGERGVIVLDPELVESFTLLSQSGQQAKREFWLANQGLVVLAARMKTAGSSDLSWRKLVPEILPWLGRAINKFDYKLGYKFSTYAMPWLLQGAQRYIERLRNNMPGDVARMTEQLWQDTGRYPTYEEVAVALQLDSGTVEPFMRVATASMVRLDARIDGDPSTDWSNKLPSDADTAQDVERGMLTDTLQQLIDACLPDTQAKVLRLVLGLDGLSGAGLDFKVIGPMFGHTEKWAANIYGRALDTLRYIAGQGAPAYFNSNAVPKARRLELIKLREKHGAAAQALIEFWMAS